MIVLPWWGQILARYIGINYTLSFCPSRYNSDQLPFESNYADKNQFRLMFGWKAHSQTSLVHYKLLFYGTDDFSSVITEN